MIDLIKKIFKREKEIVHNTHTVLSSTAKEEIAEIKDLNLSEVDQVQGDVIASIALAAMASMGIPVSATMREIIKVSAAYALRDFKEGCTNPEKLIVMRVLNKIREIREAKAASQDKQP